jgi:uncharacterized protein (TIGR01777 family)
MKIAVTGSSGLIGSALVPALLDAGHEVVRLVRSRPAAPNERQWDPAAGTLDPAALRGVDAAVNLAGVSIGASRWNDRQRQAIVRSRVDATSLLARTLAGLDPRPEVLVSSSAVGVYGDGGDAELTEDSPPGEGFLADVSRQWEAATAPAAEAGIRTVLIRTGIVLGADAPAVRRMVLPFKLGAGGRLGSGRQYWSWIALDDVVGAILHLLESDVAGPVNLTAPGPRTNAEFATTLGKVLRRPSLLPAPGFALKALLGGDMADELLLEGQRALPARLVGSGFEFRYPDLETALRHALGR